MTYFDSARKLSGWRFPELTAGHAELKPSPLGGGRWETGVKECNWIYFSLAIYPKKYWGIPLPVLFWVLETVDQFFHSVSSSRMRPNRYPKWSANIFQLPFSKRRVLSFPFSYLFFQIHIVSSMSPGQDTEGRYTATHEWITNIAAWQCGVQDFPGKGGECLSPSGLHHHLPTHS